MDSVADPINLVSIYSECGNFMLRVPTSIAHRDFSTLWKEYCKGKEALTPFVLVLSIEELQS